MTHRRAVALMILATLLWSIAGVVTRHLDAARSFEVTFWRSLFVALTLGSALSIMRGPAFWRDLATARWPLWVSGCCGGTMYTAFMIGLTLTSVANVLVTLAVGPLVTALFARLFLGPRLPRRTWVAIALGGAGIAWMFGQDALTGASLTGTLVAFAAPLAASVNWTLLQSMANRPQESPPPPDMLPAVLIGAVLSAGVTLPFAWPLTASVHDISLLALLGVVQLTAPCLLVVRISKALPAPEIALLGLLEVVFGVAWAWIGAGEQPAPATLTGGLLVIGALVFNETLGLRQRRRTRVAQAPTPLRLPDRSGQLRM
jgi:drug/metabolite transporter (DMT)-like permease